MRQKLDQFTFINGNSVEKTFMQANLLIVIIMVGMSVASTMWLSEVASETNMIFMVGLLPYLIMSITISFNTYNVEYFQLARYYMVSIEDVFIYHLKQAYSIKNIVVWLLLVTFLDVMLSLITNITMFEILPKVMLGYAFSPLFVGIGFLTATWFGKKNLWKRIIMFILLYVILVVGLVVGQFSNLWVSLPILLGCAITSLLIVYVLIKQREKNIEV